jgi:hypothetical protein
MANTTQVSAQGSGTVSWIAADTNRRSYLPAKTVAWDTGNLLGPTLYVTIPTTGYYWITFQLDSFSAAGNCNVSFNSSAGAAVQHEVTTTITLGSDSTHKAGTFTSAIFNCAVGQTFQIMGWHTGGGTCTATITVVALLL